MSAEKKYNISDETVERLITFGGGHFSPGKIEQLVQSLNDEIKRHYFTSQAEANLNRIFAAQFDKISFLLDCIKYPLHIEIIVAIAVHSNYLTDIVVMNPGYLYQLFIPEYLHKTVNLKVIQTEIENGIKRFNSFTAKLNFLRNYKKRTILKVGLSDIFGLADLITTTNNISILANKICAALFNLCYNEVTKKYKIQNDTGKYTLASLGKLGGNELNYSSDIDLILFYDKNYLLDSPIKIEYHTLISETVQLFIQSSTENKGSGILYRIDFRLRPEGRYAPLARSINDYLKYYEVIGENWERQMLIKLNFVTGSRVLFDSFKNLLNPFIYPSSFIITPLEEIRKMKIDIEAENGSENNIKLFHGGIRDIEFSVQALQLLNGGKNENLQTGNTIEAINRLSSAGLFCTNESERLINAYTFYRRIEHYLQLMNDLQTHSIPSKGELPEKISRFLGFNSINKLNKEIETHRKSVRDIFDSITLPSNSSGNIVQTQFKNIGFQQSNRAISNYRYLKMGVGISENYETDKITIRNFNQIEPSLLSFLNKTLFPDRSLENFTKIVKNTKLISVWYSEFRNTKLFNDFLKVCEISQRAVDDISINQFNGELFLSKKVFTKNIKELYDSLSVKQILFILTIQFTLKLIDREIFSKYLSGCIQHKIDRIIESVNLNYIFFIGGLGSFSTEDMIFSSDVDLIIVADNIAPDSNIQSDFQNLLIKLQEELQPFKPDIRLRPEGNNSLLVIELTNYKKYLNSRARIWEFQSLLKLKFAGGNKKLFAEFKDIVLKAVKKLKPFVMRKEIIYMYSLILKHNVSYMSDLIDMKTAKGSLEQIEFFLDSYLLADNQSYRDNFGKNINYKIDYLIKNGSVNRRIKTLKDNYNFLQETELAVQNILNKNITTLPVKEDEIKLLEYYINGNLINDITAHITKMMNDNSKIMESFWKVMDGRK